MLSGRQTGLGLDRLNAGLNKKKPHTVMQESKFDIIKGVSRRDAIELRIQHGFTSV